MAVIDTSGVLAEQELLLSISTAPPFSLDALSPEFLPIFMKLGNSKFFTFPLIFSAMQECLISLIHSIIKLTACCLSDASLVKGHQIGQGTGARHIREEMGLFSLKRLNRETEPDSSQRQTVMGQEAMGSRKIPIRY